MYKLYQGNTGRVRRVEEGPERPVPAARPVPAPPPVRQPGPPQQRPRPSGPLGRLPKVLEDLETEDLLLLLILYLMYRESGDSELLMIMGGMFL